MSIEITARHMHATEALQEYAKRKASDLMEGFRKVEHVHVILDHQRHLSMAEVVVQVKAHPRVEAAFSSDNMSASIDGAFDRIEKQLRKVQERVHDHKPAMKFEEKNKRKGSEA